MPDICIEEASVVFPAESSGRSPVVALSGIDLEVPDRQFVCLLGPSGCGKSTLLNLVAGFLEPTSGVVRVGGDEVTSPAPTRGVVFQDANIFPWLTVAKNVAFGPSVSSNLTKREIAERVDEYLASVGLMQFKDHLPMELSGGMRQRVSLARVLINDPPILLMDEPFGALDAQTRIVMQELLLELWERDRKTVVFVTHDIDEALLLADRIYVMSIAPGRIRDYIDVPLGRPRNYEMTNSSEFRGLRHNLFQQLHDEAVVAASGAASV